MMGILTTPKTSPKIVNACLACKEATKRLEYCGSSMAMSEYIPFALCRMQCRKTSLNSI